MNQNWKNFLINNNAIFNNDEVVEFSSKPGKQENILTPITHLSILSVSGLDATQFLQGQVTCNITEDLNDNKSSLGAICTSKGRVISTFLAIKKETTYLLVLPTALLAIVKKRLQMYVLRADVKLTDCNDQYCLIGLSCTQPVDGFPQLPFEVFQNDSLIIKYPSQKNRYLIIEKVEQAKQFWSKFIDENMFIPTGNAYWLELDIVDGIPWLTEQTSEEFIPQMLNLDQLGAISFKKGCYTGQEIIARTHYRGKTKRKMYFAEYQSSEAPIPGAAIQNMGKVLTAQCDKGKCKILVVAAEDVQLKQNQVGITLSDLPYLYLN